MDRKILEWKVLWARITNWFQENLRNSFKEAGQIVKGVVVAISDFEELKFEIWEGVFQDLKEKCFK